MFNSHAYHSGTDPSFGYALGASAKPLSADGSQGQNDGDPCTTSDGSEGEWHGETCVPIKGIVEVDVDSGAADVVVDTGLGKLIENVDASVSRTAVFEDHVGNGIPCAPTGKQLRSNPSLRNKLVSLLRNDSGHRTDNPREYGGWVYQYTIGKSKGLFFFQPATSDRRDAGSIDLTNPGTIKDARVIAKVHTHPFTTRQQNYINQYESKGEKVPVPSGYLTSPLWSKRASGPSEQDGQETDLPSLVVYEAVEFGKGDKTYFWIASVGANRVDNRGCQ